MSKGDGGLQRLANAFLFDVRGSWFDQAIEMLPDSGPILDLACGKGRFLAKIGSRGVGLDWNAESLRWTQRVSTRLTRGSVLSLPFADGTFAGVHAADIIEHFGPADARQLLSEAARVLRPGGRLVISTPHLKRSFYNDPTHVRPYPPESILSFCVPADAKGGGTNPTLGDLAAPVKFVSMQQRHAALIGPPRYLLLPEGRSLHNALRPRSLAFYAANLVARVGVRNPRPAGYLIALERLS